MTPVKILVICGSIRSKGAHAQALLEVMQQANDIEGYIEALDGLGTECRLCNSEIIAGAAMVGAKKAGAEFEYFPLLDLFPQRSKPLEGKGAQADLDLLKLDTLALNENKLNQLLSLLKECDGVVLATPVYFGDRSSVANKILQLSSVRARVKDKVYGIVSVGAKRNGGQETCNIYSLYEMLGHGALGVGNGLPTSQYGGTAVGGDKGSVLNDRWGLLTALGTGERVTHVARLVKAGREETVANQSEKNGATITFLITMDSVDGKLAAQVDSLVAGLADRFPALKTRVVNIVNKDVFRCLGCNKCPKEKGKITAECTINDNLSEVVADSFNDTDGFIVCGINPGTIEELVTRYQVFTERLRCIRRNDYQLSDKLVAGLCLHEGGATINPIHSLKVMTSYVRHNTVLHRPIEMFSYDGKILRPGTEGLESFCQSAWLLAQGKSEVPMQKTVYNPYGEGAGYKDA